jgi:hypothetical protein
MRTLLEQRFATSTGTQAVARNNQRALRLTNRLHLNLWRMFDAAQYPSIIAPYDCAGLLQPIRK